MKEELKGKFTTIILFLFGTIILSFDYLLFIKLEEINKQLEQKLELLKKYRDTIKKLPKTQEEYKNLYAEYNNLLKFIFNDPNESLAYASFSEFLTKLAVNIGIKEINISRKNTEKLGNFIELRLSIYVVSEDLEKILRFIERIEYNKQKILRVGYAMIKKELRLKNEIYRLNLIVSALWKKGKE